MAILNNLYYKGKVVVLHILNCFVYYKSIDKFCIENWINLKHWYFFSVGKMYILFYCADWGFKKKALYWVKTKRGDCRWYDFAFKEGNNMNSFHLHLSVFSNRKLALHNFSFLLNYDIIIKISRRWKTFNSRLG